MIRARKGGRSKQARITSRTGSVTTLQQLARPSRRTHDANFSKVLPRKMTELVVEGLFEPDGNGSYRITEKGRHKLAELEQINKEEKSDDVESEG